jgi:preprotein translocase subunit YajC
MDLNCTATIIALGAPPPGTQQDPKGQMFQFVLMMGVMVFMFYFLMIRPQQKKAREHANLLKSVKAGDRILTSSGIIGTVISVKEKTLSIRSADAKIEITKSAIAEITEHGGNSAGES